MRRREDARLGRRASGRTGGERSPIAHASAAHMDVQTYSIPPLVVAIEESMMSGFLRMGAIIHINHQVPVITVDGAFSGDGPVNHVPGPLQLVGPQVPKLSDVFVVLGGDSADGVPLGSVVVNFVHNPIRVAIIVEMGRDFYLTDIYPTELECPIRIQAAGQVGQRQGHG
jgi:hypothetical protein